MTLPKAADPITIRRLTLARSIYQEAASHAEAPARSHRRVIAVVGFDLTNEIILKAAAWALTTGKQPSDSFDGLLQQVRSMVAKETGQTIAGMPAPLANEAAALQVHGVRNAAQHDGRPPSWEVVSDCRTHTRDFVESLATTIWDVKWDALSLVGTVQTEAVRERLLEAEALLEDGKLLDGARSASKGLHLALYYARGFPRHFWKSEDRVMRELQEEIAELQATVDSLSLGFDIVSERKLRRLTGTGWQMLRGEQWSQPLEPIDQGSAEWAVEYCARAVLGLEEQLGELQDPFEAQVSRQREAARRRKSPDE